MRGHTEGFIDQNDILILIDDIKMQIGGEDDVFVEGFFGIGVVDAQNVVIENLISDGGVCSVQEDSVRLLL